MMVAAELIQKSTETLYLPLYKEMIKNFYEAKQHRKAYCQHNQEVSSGEGFVLANSVSWRKS